MNRSIWGLLLAALTGCEPSETAPSTQDGGVADGARLSDAGGDEDASQRVSNEVSVRLSVGDHGCLIMADQSVRCWGRGGMQSLLGDGTDEPRATTVTVMGLDGVTAIAAGEAHTCAIRRDGAVWCWGRNESGQLGDGTTEARNAPVRVMGIDGAVEVRVSSARSCVRRSDATVWCWGFAREDGATHRTPTQVSQAAGAEGIALNDATVFGTPPRAGLCVLRRDGTAWCFPEAARGATGPTTLAQVPSIVDAVELSSGRAATCARTRAGEVWCWGSNESGQLGAGDLEARDAPVRVEGIRNAAGLAVGNVHACARLQDGTVQCWGSNSYGQLGASSVSRQPTPAPVPGVTDVAEVAAGVSGTCALSRSGAVSCWGNRGNGLLVGVVPSGSDDRTPRLVPGLPFGNRLDVGDVTSCATSTAGRTLCWGNDLLRSGEMPSTHLFPSEEGAPQGVVSFVGVGNHQCAITVGATVQCWGFNAHGQVGSGDTTFHSTPVDVPELTDVTRLALGQEHSCALRRDGTVWCWGSNQFFQVAREGQRDRLAPVQIEGLPRVTALASMALTVCALAEDRRVYCWGRDVSGETGQGKNMFWRAAPVVVPGLSGVMQIASARGGTQICVIRDAGAVACWGAGSESVSGAVRAVPGLTDAVDLVVFGRSRCVRVRDGGVRCWQFADAEGAPVALEGVERTTSLVAGTGHACALASDGRVWCWGSDSEGQLGDGCFSFGCATARFVTFSM